MNERRDEDILLYSFDRTTSYSVYLVAVQSGKQTPLQVCILSWIGSECFGGSIGFRLVSMYSFRVVRVQLRRLGESLGI